LATENDQQGVRWPGQAKHAFRPPRRRRSGCRPLKPMMGGGRGWRHWAKGMFGHHPPATNRPLAEGRPDIGAGPALRAWAEPGLKRAQDRRACGTQPWTMGRIALAMPSPAAARQPAELHRKDQGPARSARNEARHGEARHRQQHGHAVRRRNCGWERLRRCRPATPNRYLQQERRNGDRQGRRPRARARAGWPGRPSAHGNCRDRRSGHGRYRRDIASRSGWSRTPRTCGKASTRFKAGRRTDMMKQGPGSPDRRQHEGRRRSLRVRSSKRGPATARPGED